MAWFTVSLKVQRSSQITLQLPENKIVEKCQNIHVH